MFCVFWQKTLDSGQDLAGGLGPFEGLEVLVVPVDEGADVGLQLPDRGMDAAAEALSGQLGKPAFDLIDPGRRSRHEVHGIVRPAGEPRLDLVRLVGGVVAHDDMDVEPFGDPSVDLFEEVQELGGAMAPVALADEKPDATSRAANSDVVPCLSNPLPRQRHQLIAKVSKGVLVFRT